MHVLSEANRAKLDLLGMRWVGTCYSVYEPDKFFLVDRRVVDKHKHMRQRGKKRINNVNSPFATFTNMDEAIAALTDKSGKYYWE